MKKNKTDSIDKIFLVLGLVVIVVFVVRSLWTWARYTFDPEFWLGYSAPWYLSIELEAIFSLLVLLVLALIWWILKRRAKKSGL